ncbi:hypothetical protein ES703_101484 [subsurface metagenome]
MAKTQEQPKAKASQKDNRKKTKPKRTNKDVLALCVQAIRDAKHDMEFLYDWITGDYPGSPKTIDEVKDGINKELGPKLSNFMMIENQLTKGRKQIQIGDRLLDGADWKLAEIRDYLRYLEIASTSDITTDCPGAFVDSIHGAIDYKITILEQAIGDLKEIFGGQGWSD